MAFVKEDDLYQNYIKHVQDYMFNNTTICKSIEHKLHQQYNTKKIKKHEEKQAKIIDNIFIPNDNDTLFWCLYIIKNGLTNYTQMTNRNLVVEKQFKIEYVERLRKEKTLIKQYKLDSLTNIENSLANENKIDMNTFLMLCVIGSLNIFFIKKNTYYELNMNDSNKIYIIKYISEKDQYGFEEINKDDLTDFRNNYYKVENLSKPIKSISSYKTQELLDICNKLGISIHTENDKTKSKKELYESIIKYF
jgi:hypothetical protein